MSWLSRNNFTPSDKIHADDLNNLANDDRTWGGNVNGGGYTLSNVVLVGVKTTASGGVVNSVFGRTGDVVAVSGDYTAAQVGAVPTARQVLAGSGMIGGGPLTADITLSAQVTSVFGRVGVITLTPADITGATGVLNSRLITTGAGLTGGGNLSADRTLSVVPDTTNQQVVVMAAGNTVGTRHAVNFVAGSNISLAVTDDSANNRVNLTVTSVAPPGDLVDPTTTVGDLIVRGPSSTTRLAVGPNGQVLTTDSTQPLGMKWIAPAVPVVTSVFGRVGTIVAATGDYTAAQVTNAVDATVLYTNPAWIVNLPWPKITNAPAFMTDPTTTRGDLILRGAASTARLPVGADGLVLIADAAQGLGVRWGQITTVNSVFGRNGAVIAQSGDYNVAQVTNAVANTRAVNTGAGLAGGGNLTIDRTLSVVPDTTNQQVVVMDSGNAAGTRHAINFVSGANISLSIGDDPANNRVNISISSTGGSGGMVDPTSTVGDLIVRGGSAVQRLAVGFNGQALVADSSQLLGVKWATVSGGAGSQSPWTTDIDAAGHILGNTPAIGVNKAAAASTARLDVLTTGAEDGLRIVNNAPTRRASLTLANDGGTSLVLAAYGSNVLTDPGITGVETSEALKFSVQGANVMRLNAGGHVLIGTAADDGVHLLQVNGSIRSASGGYIFPDGSTQTTAAVTQVTSVFGRVGAVVAQTGDYTAAQVTSAVSITGSYADPAWITSLSWSKITGAPGGVTSVFGRTGVVTATTGDYNAAQVANAVSILGSYADPTWITALNWSKITGAPAIIGQTPWLSDIDAASFTLKSAGKIGIGTVPSSLLHVRGSGLPAVLIENTAGSAAIELKDSTGTPNRWWMVVGVGTATDGKFGLYDARQSTARLTIDTAGNVGITTTSPAFPLSLGSGVIARKLAVYDSGSDFFGFGVASGQLRYDSGSSADHVFYTSASTERMRIASNGNVGIGTTTPSALLHVVAGGVGPVIAARLECSDSGPATSEARLVFGEGGSWYQGIGGPYNSTNPALTFSVNTAAATWAERMRITSAGRVGIGTANPLQALSLITANRTTPGTADQFSIGEISNNPAYRLTLGFYSDGSTYKGVVQVTNNGPGSGPLLLQPLGGNVGIGTIAAAAALSLGYVTNEISLRPWPNMDQGCFAFYVTQNFPATNSYVRVLDIVAGSGNAGGGIRLVTSQPGAAGATAMYLAPAGFVGVGTSAPVAKLDVVPGSTPYNWPLSGAGGFRIATDPWNSAPSLFAGVDGNLPASWLQAVQAGVVANPLLLNPNGGNVGVGSSASQLPFTVYSGTTQDPSLSAHNGIFMYYAANGVTLTAGVGGSYTALWLQGKFSGNDGRAFPIALNPLGGGVSIGKGSPAGYTLDVVGDVNCSGTFRVNGAAFTSGVQVQQNGAGIGTFPTINFVNGGSGTLARCTADAANNRALVAIDTPSDLRIKRNVADLSGGLPAINRLRPVSFEYNGLCGFPAGKRSASVIAQELREVLPDAVYTARTSGTDDVIDLLCLDPMAIISHLILAVQQLERRLKDVEQRPN